MEAAKLKIPNYWEEHIQAWKSTGLSQAKYCRKQQLKPHQFSYYKCQLIKQQKLHTPPQASAFIELSPAINSMAQVTNFSLSLQLAEQTSIKGITEDNIHLVKILVGYLR